MNMCLEKIIERYAHSDVLRCYKSKMDLLFWDLKVVKSEFIESNREYQLSARSTIKILLHIAIFAI